MYKILCFLLLIGCTNHKFLIERLPTKVNREFHLSFKQYQPMVVEECMKTEPRVFVDTTVVGGFDKELIKYLYGKPNKVFMNDSLWYYVKRFDTQLRLLFNQYDILMEVKYLNN